MHKIKEITLQNFKFFYGKNKIPLNRNHALIYGENGSGKSSIYWALYTFLQSIFKEDPNDVRNYFNPRHDFSLVNRYANGSPAFIEVVFEDEDQDLRTKRISNTTVNTRGDGFIESCTLSSDLIDYKAIFNIYNFSNRERVKLFNYFEKHLLMFINFRMDLVDILGINHTNNSEKWWQYLSKGLNPYPNIGGPGYWEFQSLIETFNSEFEYYLNSITETANLYLSERFKEKFEISFEYKKSVYNELIDGARTRTTEAPEIFLNVKLIDPNLDGISENVYRAHTFLNEARLSSIALAIRMAILREKYVVDVPKILILDDLLLSLDMGNREAVLNIVLEEYCDDYQLILLTHDRVFFETVLSFIKTFHSNKLRSSGETNRDRLDKAFEEKWKILEMYESSLTDGKMIPVLTEHKSNIQKAHFYFNDAEGIDYNACGNNLRAALEEFFKGYIPKEYLRDGHGNPFDKNCLTLNPLIERCIIYFNFIGWNTLLLDRLNRYRERALNQTSHYNPNSNYFKKELQDTFEILNALKLYRADPIIVKDELLNFSVLSTTKVEYSFVFKPLDDIRLYLENIPGSVSFYCINEKRTYGFVEFIDNGITSSFDIVVRGKTLHEFYYETIDELEKNKNETCIRQADPYDVIKNREGKSLNELKSY